MENAFLQDLPSWIDFGTALVPGKGIPTVTYLTLRQMKLFKVQFGELTAAKMSTIQNVEAVMQLEQMTRSPDNTTLDQAVAKTHSVQYATTSIEQSGNTIIRVRIDTQNSWRWKLQEMMDYFNIKPAQRRELFAKYGLRPEDEVLVNYDIWIDIAPHPKNPSKQIDK